MGAILLEFEPRQASSIDPGTQANEMIATIAAAINPIRLSKEKTLHSSYLICIVDV